MKLLKNTLFLLILLTFSVKLKAQDLVIDSLKLSLKKAKYDTTRIRILAELSEICEVEEILVYTEPCINIAEKHFIKIEKNQKNEIYFKYYANALNNAGFFYKQKGNNSKALMLYYKSLKIREEVKDIFGEAVAYNNIGRIYFNLKDFNKAIEFHEKALKLQEEGLKTIKSEEEKIETSKEMATSINNIAGIYFTQNKVDKAIEYYQKSLMIRKKINDLDGIANSLNNLGFIFMTKKNIKVPWNF